MRCQWPWALTVLRTLGADEEIIELHSGAESGTNGINLNEGLFSSPGEGSIVSETVAWIYVRTDGSKGNRHDV